MMVDRGRTVLYGKLSDIKASHRSHAVFINSDELPGEIPGVTETRSHKEYLELVLDELTTPKQVLAFLTARGININRFEIATPSLNEIFLKVAGRSHE